MHIFSAFRNSKTLLRQKKWYTARPFELTD
jgi:hypothetical protein